MINKIIRLILVSTLICGQSFAATTLVKRFPSDTPVKVAPLSGSTTNGNCVQFDVDGNIVDSGAGCGGSGLGDITAVGDTLSGAAFTGTSGTALTFNGTSDGQLNWSGSTFRMKDVSKNGEFTISPTDTTGFIQYDTHASGSSFYIYSIDNSITNGTLGWNGDLSIAYFTTTLADMIIGNASTLFTISTPGASVNKPFSATSLESTKIGSSSAADATFNSVVATRINGTKIGDVTAADATFNNVTANTNIKMAGGTSNRIFYGAVGAAAPGANSAGEKIQLFGTTGVVGSTDYAIGIESSYMWFNSPGGFNWYVNSANVMNFNVNGNLGLGTVSPTYTFDVTGSIRATGTLNLGTALTTSMGGTGSPAGFSTYSPIFAGTTSTGAFQSGTLGAAGSVLTSNGAGTLPTFKPATGGAGLTIGAAITGGSTKSVLFEDNSNQLAESSNLTFDGTTTGIVTANIDGGTIDGTKIGSTAAADATFSAVVATSLDGARIGFTSAKDATFNTVWFGTIGNGKFKSNGNISGTDATFSTIIATKIDSTKIGTSSAADATFSSVSIISPGSVAQPTRGLFVDQYSDDVSGAATIWRKARGSSGSPTQALANDALGFFGFRGYTSTPGFSAASNAYIQATAAENFTSSATGAFLQFATTPTGSTTSAIAATILGNGNFGVATITPNYKFDVTGSIRATSSIVGGSLESTKIGSTTAADATFNAITATRMEATKIGFVTAADATFNAVKSTTATFGVNTTISSTGTVTANGLNLQQKIIDFTLSTTIATPTTTVGNNCAQDNGWTVSPIFTGFKVVSVSASVTTVSPSGILTLNLKNRTTGNNILSTALTIDATELNTSTAATPAVIDQANNTLTSYDDVCAQISVAPNGSFGARAEMVIQK